MERVNVQLALNAYEAAVDNFNVVGLQSDISNYGGVSLTGLLAGSWHGPGEAGRQHVSVDVDVGETVDCLRAGLILTEFEETPIAALIYVSEHRHPPELVVEVVSADQATADGFVGRLRALMDEHNAFRGKVGSRRRGRSCRPSRIDRSVVTTSNDRVRRRRPDRHGPPAPWRGTQCAPLPAARRDGRSGR